MKGEGRGLRQLEFAVVAVVISTYATHVAWHLEIVMTEGKDIGGVPNVSSPSTVSQSRRAKRCFSNDFGVTSKADLPSRDAPASLVTGTTSGSDESTKQNAN